MTRRLVPLLVVLALVAAGCSALGSVGSYTVHAEFAKTYNLFPGSPVRLLGVEVGKVADLHVSSQRETVLVDLVIEDHVTLPADVGAVIIPQSLLGERYVQLGPPHTEGPSLDEGGTIPVERTQIPAEFDEILESLNRFVGGLDKDEFARFISNLADVVDGRGQSIGRTIDQTHQAIKALRDTDDELVSLVSRLADLNGTLSTRDQAIAQLLRDWNTVASTIVDEQDDLDRALSGLLRLTTQVAGLLETHRTDLQADVATLARVTRTVDRNIDEIARMILWGAELFRHAQRVVKRSSGGWLPLVNHGNEELGTQIEANLADRLQHLCAGLGLPGLPCDQLTPANLNGGASFCMEPLVPCSPDEGAATLADVLRNAIAIVPELEDALGSGGLPGVPDGGSASSGEGVR
ncbi:MAG TPA: MCE family protein [Nitriliruptorales bacterium]